MDSNSLLDSYSHAIYENKNLKKSENFFFRFFFRAMKKITIFAINRKFQIKAQPGPKKKSKTHKLLF